MSVVLAVDNLFASCVVSSVDMSSHWIRTESS